ncbi:uncharacterized protein LOC141852467 [Brevipalpus obovatus]|uniref:uncharacterized protein LOC141852467 n=1 Tax=Brevipalpus obovatus TaxID=246614 RepID=UPI003D9E7E54
MFSKFDMIPLEYIVKCKSILLPPTAVSHAALRLYGSKVQSSKLKSDKKNELKSKILNNPWLFSETPKPPRKAFQLFMDKRMAEIGKDGSLGKEEVIQRIKKEWETFEKKSVYEETYDEEFKKYLLAKECFTSLMNIEICLGTAMEIVDEILKLNDRNRKDRNKLKFEYPTSAYKLFFKEYTESKKLNKEEAPNLGMIGAAYRSLTKDEKSNYERRAEMNKSRLEKALEEWSKKNTS